jgi:mannosyltransferase OCH1-like enzyme
MNPVIFFCNRVIKILANASKIVSYLFHLFFPRKRFVIPKHSRALFATRRHFEIPLVLWQTNFTNHVTLPIYLNYLFNRLLSPTHEYRFMDNEDCLAFIKENCSAEILENYLKLKVGASRADFWRLLVLEHKGGVYLDVDAHFVWPLSWMLKTADTEMYVKSKNNRYTNYFLASRKDNPHIRIMIDIVMGNIRKADSDSVYELTGPPCVNQALEGLNVPFRSYQHTCSQGDFTNEHFQYLDRPGSKWTHAKNR